MAINEEVNTQMLLTLSKELLKQIDDYRFEKRVKNRSEAVRELIVKGLERSK